MLNEELIKDHRHTGADFPKIRANDIDGLAAFVENNAPALTPDTVNMIVGESVSVREVLYEDQYGFHLKADSDAFSTVNRRKGVVATATVGATESGVAAGSAHEHYEVTTSTDYVAGNTTPATIIGAASNTNTTALASSNDTDQQTSTTTAGRYCYQLIRWDADATVTQTIQRIKVLVEASAGGTGQTSGWSAYVWDITNSQWDLVGTSGLAYSTDETIQNAFVATDYVEATTNYVYVLIKTTGTESGGGNALNLDVDFASLMVGVNCPVYVRGDITGYSFAASDVGRIAKVSGTAGALTTGFTKIYAPMGIVADTSTLMLNFSPDITYSPNLLIPRKAYATTDLLEIFGQSNTVGRIAHHYMASATSLRGHDDATLSLQGLSFGVEKQTGATTVTSGNLIYDCCNYADRYITAYSNSAKSSYAVVKYDSSGGTDWTITSGGDSIGFITSVCTDGTYVYMYDIVAKELRRKLYSTGANPGSGTNTLAITSAGTAMEGPNALFYWNNAIWLIRYSSPSSTTTIVEVIEVPPDFSGQTPTTLFTETHDSDQQDLNPEQDSFFYYWRDYIMPFNDGQIYLVGNFGNIYQASSFIDLNGF